MNDENGNAPASVNKHKHTYQNGKGESLAKISTALNCGLNDIVEIQKDGE